MRSASIICRAVSSTRVSDTHGNIHYWLGVAWRILHGMISFESLGPAYAAAGGGLVCWDVAFSVLARVHTHVCSLARVAGFRSLSNTPQTIFSALSAPPACFEVGAHSTCSHMCSFVSGPFRLLVKPDLSCDSFVFPFPGFLFK